MKEEGTLSKNTVVSTVMSNMGLYKALESENIISVKTDVGDKYVYEAMKNDGYSLGGEESGHIIFSKYATTGDGLITAIKLMEVYIETKLPASKLSDGFVRFPQLTVNIRVADKDVVLNDPDVLNERRNAEETLSNNGRVLLRKSGTEPVVRVMVEAESDEMCATIANRIADIIKSKFEIK